MAMRNGRVRTKECNLDGERHGFAGGLGDNIIVEEVAVDGGLDGPENPDDPVPVARFSEETIDPVNQVHGTVATEAEHVVRGEILDETTGLLGVLVDNNELGDNGEGFKVDGESPQDLSKGEVLVPKKSQDGARDKNVGEEEGVVFFLIGVGVWALELHQVDDEDGGGDENHFHHTVVQGHEVEKQVQVASDENEGIEELTLEGDTFAVLQGVHLQQQDENAHQVHHIAC